MGWHNSMADIIAHRGYSGKYPENTLLAFKKAYEFGAHGFELDVHMTKDGRLVVCHDETIDRTSNGSGSIQELTLKQIQSYQFLAEFPEFAETEDHQDITAPSLQEVFEWYKDLPEAFRLNIELKTDINHYPDIVQKTLSLVDEYGLADRVFISSFNSYTILEVRERNPEIETGFLTLNAILDAGEYCKRYGVENYHPYHVMLSQADVDSAKREQVRVNAYTANKPEEIQRMIALDIEGIITNEVELALSLISK